MPFVRMSRGGGLFTRAVSVLVAITFIFSSISFAIPEERKTAAPTHQELVTNPEKIVVPRELGLVKSKFIGNEGRLVVHIQDAHCNYAAQHRIADIIEYLNKEYGIETVNLEGGTKGYDLAVFTEIADKAVRDKVADYFVKDGKVSGPEYFAINNPGKVNLWCIEDAKLYIENLNVYRESLKYKGDADKIIRSLSSMLTNLKVKIYSGELLEFDAKYIQ